VTQPTYTLPLYLFYYIFSCTHKLYCAFIKFATEDERGQELQIRK
jgi:hypothetical protein